MQLSNIPPKIVVPFAATGSKRTIPVLSQIGVTPGAASYTDGFPPLTFTPLASGGIPPAGQDFNGILNAITLVQQWQAAGGSFAFDASWAASNNGYPKGALLMRADGTGYWFNTTDNNTSDPDGATPTGWVPEWQYGITAVTGLTNANVTLTSLQYGRPVVTLAGVLTGNVQIVFPAFPGQQWVVANNTTGNFTVTAKTAAGAGVAVPRGGAVPLWGDGTNLVAVSAPGRFIGERIITATGTYTPSAGCTSYTADVVAGGGAGGGVPAAPGASVAGGGGSAGAEAHQYFQNTGPVSVTIGAGGTGAVGAAGGNGSATTFNGITCPGGNGGAVSLTPTPPAVSASGGLSSGVPTGSFLYGRPGGVGTSVGLLLSANAAISGAGGASTYGTAGGPVGQNSGPLATPGAAATGYGAGGSGALGINNGAQVAGGNGAPGVVVIREFA